MLMETWIEQCAPYKWGRVCIDGIISIFKFLKFILIRFVNSEKFCLGGITSKVRRWLLTFALVVIGVGYSGSLKAAYWPHGNFNGSVVEAFKINSVYEFPADEPASGRWEGGTRLDAFMNKVKYQTCPNMMSVCMVTWINQPDSDDDYDMEWTKLYMYNKSSGESKQLCTINTYSDACYCNWLSGLL